MNIGQVVTIQVVANQLGAKTPLQSVSVTASVISTTPDKVTNNNSATASFKVKKV